MPTRITQGGRGPLELGTEAFGRRLAGALPDQLRDDLASRLSVDVDRLVERFGWILVHEIRRVALAPKSRLQALVTRLEASQLQEAVGRVGHCVGLEDGGLVLLQHQQRTRSDREAIAEATRLLAPRRAAARARPPRPGPRRRPPCPGATANPAEQAVLQQRLTWTQPGGRSCHATGRGRVFGRAAVVPGCLAAPPRPANLWASHPCPGVRVFGRLSYRAGRRSSSW